MAKVIGPGFSQWASGRVGAVEYTRWRGIMVARTSEKGTQPNTPLQQSRQAILTQATKDWSESLSESDREAWREYAKNKKRINEQGMEYQPSGYELFVMVTMRRYMYGYTLSYQPPDVHEPVVPVEYKCDWNSVTKKVTLGLVKIGGELANFDRQRHFHFETASGGRVPIESEWRSLQAWDNTLWTFGWLSLEKYHWFKNRWFTSDGVFGNWHVVRIFTST